ncbi:MAG: hypothetical protein JST19_06725, partial [Bacteroidetes bacterium]|nr:hypothetical protein [Bacteroidota bacterium]
MYDKYIIAILLAGTFLLVIFAIFLIYFVIYMRAKRNSYYIERQRILLDSQAGKIEESERLSYEVGKAIHDNILQLCCVAKMQLGQMKKSDGDIITHESIDYLYDLVEQTIDESYKICAWLNYNTIMSYDIVDILKAELQSIEKTKSINFNIEVKGTERPLNIAIKAIVLRIAREAFQNVV